MYNIQTGNYIEPLISATIEVKSVTWNKTACFSENRMFTYTYFMRVLVYVCERARQYGDGVADRRTNSRKKNAKRNIEN